MGECGLDFAIEGADRTAQEKAFTTQLAISFDRGLPINIHCRGAWGRMTEILTAHGPHPAGIVLHAYGGSADIAEKLAPLNVYFSFGGSLTIPNNKKGPKALTAIPDDRLLIETDCPDIRPHGVDDNINRPQYLINICRTVAGLLKIDPEQLADRTSQNARIIYED